MTDETVERIVAAMKSEEYESSESSSAAPHAQAGDSSPLRVSDVPTGRSSAADYDLLKLIRREIRTYLEREGHPTLELSQHIVNVLHRRGWGRVSPADTHSVGANRHLVARALHHMEWRGYSQACWEDVLTMLRNALNAPADSASAGEEA